jgi:2-oxoisovalerate dehydrogenase E1 component beta subunit
VTIATRTRETEQTFNLVQAIHDTLDAEMAIDDRVVLLGEDIGPRGGVFLVTEGLFEKYGPSRVIDTPLTESGILGLASGLGLYGLKPVPEIQFVDFIYPGFDQLVSEIARIRYRTAGQFANPVVIRSPYGGGVRGGVYHSQSPEAYFAHTPGLLVAVPATPADAAGLLRTAIRGEDPVVFLEPKRIYRAVKGPVPAGDHLVPFGKGRLARKGTDATVITWGAMVQVAEAAADGLAREEVSVEVVDLRTLQPWDRELVLERVARTGRVVVLQEAPRTCGFGSEVAATIAEEAIEYLEGPIVRVTGLDTPYPYALDKAYLPDSSRVARAVRRVLEF